MYYLFVVHFLKLYKKAKLFGREINISLDNYLRSSLKEKWIFVRQFTD